VTSTVVIAVDVPRQLSSKAIDQAVVMATCRLRFLLGEAWRKQTHATVTARVNRVRSRTSAVTA
jgi:hypothetical protein